MENIDPRLLAYDAEMQLDHAEQEHGKEEQADPGFIPDFLPGDDPFHYCSDQGVTFPPQFDLASAYPEEPLIAKEDGFQHHVGEPLTYPGEPSNTPGPEYRALYYPGPVPPRWFPAGYKNSSTQTDEPGKVAPAPAPVATAHYHLRPRVAKGHTTPSSTSNTSETGPRKRAKAPGHPVPRGKDLKGPLSKLAASLPDIPEVDINAFVHRGADDRIMRGQIMRPANAFLLYRRAYLAQAEALTGSNRHAELSRAVGASWRMESEAVKERFHEYARVERGVHEWLFPYYVYQPGKRIPAHMGRLNFE